jgi:hypothetical protein
VRSGATTKDIRIARSVTPGYCPSRQHTSRLLASVPGTFPPTAYGGVCTPSVRSAWLERETQGFEPRCYGRTAHGEGISFPCRIACPPWPSLSSSFRSLTGPGFLAGNQGALGSTPTCPNVLCPRVLLDEAKARGSHATACAGQAAGAIQKDACCLPSRGRAATHTRGSSPPFRLLGSFPGAVSLRRGWFPSCLSSFREEADWTRLGTELSVPCLASAGVCLFAWMGLALPRLEHLVSGARSPYAPGRGCLHSGTVPKAHA